MFKLSSFFHFIILLKIKQKVKLSHHPKLIIFLLYLIKNIILMLKTILLQKQQSSIKTDIFDCYISHSHFIIDFNKQNVQNDAVGKLLKIDRKKKQIIQISRNQVNLKDISYIKRSFSCFFGVAIIQQIYFLVFCNQCIEIVSNQKIQCYQIRSMLYLSYLTEGELKQKKKKYKSIQQKIQNLNELLSFGFYFSVNYNLTQSAAKQHLSSKQQFTWNRNYLKQLSKKNNVSNIWKISVIQGFVGKFNSHIEGVKLQYMLVSRRSCQKGGTRYFDRGVNEQGYVANFVETEQILFVKNFLMSDLQIRGSVPIYFQQKGLTTKVSISRSNDLTRNSFIKHFEYCSNNYDRTFIVNLLATKKKGQHSITLQYQKHIKQTSNKKIKYLYFDFHHQCSSNFSNINPTIRRVSQMRKNLQVYVQDLKTKQVYQKQVGIFRTNCLDCLDRTNFFQAKLALQTLQVMLSNLGISLKQSFGCSAIQQMDKTDNVDPLIKHFKNVWADNGDKISYHYTGTGSTHTDITRVGTRKLKGQFTHKFKSITRFYNQNFWDFHKMKLIDQLLQSGKSYLQLNQIPRKLNQRINEFCQFQNIKISLLSWKLSSINPPNQLIDFGNCDITIIGFQQVQSKSVFNYYVQTNVIDKWVEYINKCLAKYDEKFTEFNRSYECNNFIICYIRDKHKNRLSNIEKSCVKFSSYFNTYLSNKCCVLSRFSFDDTTFVFANCQLQYGKQYRANRIYNIKEIYQQAFQQQQVGKKKSQRIDENDYKFLFGNLNINIRLEQEMLKSRLTQIIKIKNDMQSKIKKQPFKQLLEKNIKEIIKFDQFQYLKTQSNELSSYDEGEINFIPPYKYIKGKCALQVSKNGGWVDRILFSTKKQIKVEQYRTLQMFYSDHLPVIGMFTARVQKQDEIKKQQIYQQILKQLDVMVPIQEEQQNKQN